MEEERHETCDAMREDWRSRWELERCDWGDEAIELRELLCLKDHIAESRRIHIVSANAVFTLLHFASTIVYTRSLQELHTMSRDDHKIRLPRTKRRYQSYRFEGAVFLDIGYPGNGADGLGPMARSAISARHFCILNRSCATQVWRNKFIFLRSAVHYVYKWILFLPSI